MKKPLSIACALLLLAAQAPAATYNVTNTLDDGSTGSLRYAVGQSTPSTSPSPNTISWGAGSGGTITLATDLTSLKDGTTLDVSSAPAAVTIAGSTITLGGGITFFNGSSTQPWTVSSDIAGSGNLVKAGSGTLVLSGANTYTGGTTLNAGAVSISSDGALGGSGGTFTVNVGTLSTTGGIVSQRTFVINGPFQFSTNGHDSSLAGSIIGGGSMTVTGGGTLTLTGSDSFSGGLYVTASTVNVSGTGTFGSGTVTLDSGVFQSGASFSASNAVYISTGGGTFDVQGASSMTLTGVISGTGALTKTSTGLLVLTGANTYTGGTFVKAGLLQVPADSALGDASGSVTLDSGTLQWGADFSSARSFTLGAKGGVFDTNGFDGTLSGALSGGALTKTGLGTLTLTRAGGGWGDTTVSGGTLAMGADGVLPIATNLIVGDGATMDFGATRQNVGTYNSLGGHSGTLRMTLTPGTTNLVASGNVVLTNTSLVVKPANALVKVGDTFTPITGTISATLSSVTGPAALSFTPTYSASSVTLTVGFVPFANTAQGGNQAAVAAA
ncbi:MAG: autotransporter-associated beta strand repeat-containing protein, partial [Elusimicrobia bacterium]|nr:autotransporter-associated beta strand repeat-containing protein [Elusimicrobiota bacterium]